MPLVLNAPGLRIWQGCQYVRVTQSSEYARILNVSDAVHSIRSLHKLLSSYCDRDVFRTPSNI